jgi:hypothetical protein
MLELHLRYKLIMYDLRIPNELICYNFLSILALKIEGFISLPLLTCAHMYFSSGYVTLRILNIQLILSPRSGCSLNILISPHYGSFVYA